MKATISGCRGNGRHTEDTDCIVQRAFAGGMIVVAVDGGRIFLENSPKNMAEEAVRIILQEWERETVLSKERLSACLQAGLSLDERMAITILVMDGRSIGIAHQGTNTLYRVNGEGIKCEVPKDAREAFIKVQKYSPCREDAFFVTTDGFDMIDAQEIFISYTKSATAQEWISYLAPSIGIGVDKLEDCYSALAIMVE